MGHFLNTYKNIPSKFSDEELETVLSAVVVLLRRHNTDNQLCCHLDEDNLKVTGVDRHGFVTKVRCTRCLKTMNTTCYDANSTKEIIHDETELKVGDHICWHRPCAIWHHAIVTALNPIMVIQTDGKCVTETALSDVHCHSKCCKFKKRCCKFCDNLYRINYEDCYKADYTVLRARKRLGEKEYNILDQNCEHFSSWCKTGSPKSSQVSVFWASLGKMTVTIILRVIALLILFLIQLSHEESEQICQGNSTVTSTLASTVTKDRCMRNVAVEYAFSVLSSAYIVVVTMIFVIYLVIASGKRLAEDPEHSVCCIPWCRRSSCFSPFTCCRRPGKLVLGVFLRIYFREVPGMVVTIVIVVLEDNVSDCLRIQQRSDAS